MKYVTLAHHSNDSRHATISVLALWLHPALAWDCTYKKDYITLAHHANDSLYVIISILAYFSFSSLKQLFAHQVE